VPIVKSKPFIIKHQHQQLSGFSSSNSEVNPTKQLFRWGPPPVEKRSFKLRRFLSKKNEVNQFSSQILEFPKGSSYSA